MSFNILLEKLLKDLGGCGRFQWVLSAIISLKIIECWSILSMAFMGQEPGYICVSSTFDSNYTGYGVSKEIGFGKDHCSEKNLTKCSHYKFESNMHTIVSEWDLVCDKAWIVAIITTLQMAGVLFSCFIAGHLGDWVGRKPVYCLSIFILVIVNVIAIFSVSWKMYAVVRFAIGIGLGFCISSQMSLVCEFLTSTWRPVYISFPTWCIMAGLFGVIAWVFKDWKKASYRYGCHRRTAPVVLVLFSERGSVGYAYYGLTFGIQNLAGDLYLNLFLMNVVELPANFITMFIVNRSTAYGLANTSTRIGGMIAPQIVFLNNHIPGLLFFLSAAMMIISSLLCCLFTETKDKGLEDTMKTSGNNHEACLMDN